MLTKTSQLKNSKLKFNTNRKVFNVFYVQTKNRAILSLKLNTVYLKLNSLVFEVYLYVLTFPNSEDPATIPKILERNTDW